MKDDGDNGNKLVVIICAIGAVVIVAVVCIVLAVAKKKKKPAAYPVIDEPIDTLPNNAPSKSLENDPLKAPTMSDDSREKPINVDIDALPYNGRGMSRNEGAEDKEDKK